MISSRFARLFRSRKEPLVMTRSPIPPHPLFRLPSRRRILAGLLSCLVFAAPLSGCSRAATEIQDGYYSAQAAEFDAHGWKEYITICVRDNRIVTVEYDARNSSGFIKSWDMDYMRLMNAADGTYPNEYTRIYSESLLNRQNPQEVDAVTGATHSYHTFQLLAEAAITQAKNGDKNIAFVEIPLYE